MLITGASEGIGRAAALEFANCGDRVLAVGVALHDPVEAAVAGDAGGGDSLPAGGCAEFL